MKLTLNSDKTEFIIIDDQYTRDELTPRFPVTFIESSILLAEEVKSIGSKIPPTRLYLCNRYNAYNTCNIMLFTFSMINNSSLHTQLARRGLNYITFVRASHTSCE